MHIKKYIFWFLFIFFSSSCISFANSYLTLQEFLQSYFNVIVQNKTIPESYKYITVQYKNISNSSFKNTLQKVIYLDMFPNVSTVLPVNSLVTQKQVSDIIQTKINIKISYTENEYVTTDRLWNVLKQVQNFITQNNNNYIIQINQSLDYWLLENMYQILHAEYIDSFKITGAQLLYGAAKGLASSIGDDYTIFMPPTQASSFHDEIQGEFPWIGAYIDTKKPWVIIIVAPIDWSPADRAGLLPGDQILKVDDHSVASDTLVDTVVSWIKWLQGTVVNITIMRNNKEITFSMKREKIIIKNIESKIYSWWICYINIRMFDFGIHKDFASAMNTFISSNTCTKYIFDVRNNPGGWLDEVATMLDYIVPANNASIIIKWKVHDQKVIATENNGKKITDKYIIILTNPWSASASEIFAGVVREYGKYAVLIGEKTFGKGSVQTITEYSDGSLFKYTIAKWYTGKWEKNIDKIWFFPDKQIYDNPQTTGDEQLDYAISYMFK